MRLLQIAPLTHLSLISYTVMAPQIKFVFVVILKFKTLTDYFYKHRNKVCRSHTVSILQCHPQ